MSAALCHCCGAVTAPAAWGPAELRLCPACGSGFLPAGQAAEAYAEDYFDGSGKGGVDYEGSKPQFQLINAKRLALLDAHRAGLPLKLLELGCALGFFMELAQDSGWQPWGVELSPFAAAKAQQRFGAQVLCGTLEQAPADWNGFGAAAAFHVLEHLPDPKQAVQDLAARLAPGGALIFEVPDFGSAKARRGRDRWAYFLPGEHLNYFTQPGLRALLEGAGFEVVAMEAVSFTRLLGPLDQAGLTGLRDFIKRHLRWFAWIKKALLALRGLAGGHDCVLVLARLKARP